MEQTLGWKNWLFIFLIGASIALLNIFNTRQIETHLDAVSAKQDTIVMTQLSLQKQFVVTQTILATDYNATTAQVANLTAKVDSLQKIAKSANYQIFTVRKSMGIVPVKPAAKAPGSLNRVSKKK